MLGQPSLQHSNGRYSFLTAFIASFWLNYHQRRVKLHNSQPLIRLPLSNFSNASGAAVYVNIAVEVLIAAILAMITTLIGVQLIGPVATAVGGGSSGTVSFQITNVVQGDFIGILAQASGSGVANGFTMTDSFGDAYTPLYTGTSFTCTNPSAGLGTASCSAFTQTISGGTITITVTETNGFMN